MGKVPEYMLRAIEKYREKNITTFEFSLNPEKNADLIEKIESQDSMQGYIKRLIREDIQDGE